MMQICDIYYNNHAGEKTDGILNLYDLVKTSLCLDLSPLYSMYVEDSIIVEFTF